MPNRKPKNKSGKTTQRTNTNAKIASLEKKLARMSTSGRAPRSSNVTPAGNMLLHGANTVAGFFGAPKIFGSGAYRMTNSMFDTEAQVPVMHSESEKIVFRHRQYIGDVACNGPTFTTKTFAVNPGLSSSFPFLASMAGSFQEYSFKGLVYEYRSTSATALVSGTNTAMGSVSMAMQYRSDAPGFISKLTMQNEMWATECRPSENMVLPVECDPKENYTKIQYVRNAPPPTNSDIKTFDLGRLTVATSGFPTGATNVIGELWASYEIEFHKPSTTLGGSEAVTLNINIPGASGTNPFGTTSGTITSNSFSPLPLPYGPLGYINGGGAPGGTNTFFFPLDSQGYYLMSYSALGTSTALATVPALSYSSNIVQVSGQQTLVGSTTTTFFFNVIVLITPNGSVPNVGIASGGMPTSLTRVSLTVTQLFDQPSPAYFV